MNLIDVSQLSGGFSNMNNNTVELLHLKKDAAGCEHPATEPVAKDL